ncbi:MAG TPA: hypothetical protein VK541_03430 [Pedobacter sp.]|uniref:protein-tyrosine phosphatase family protein n=1 Tax=Pedobacter sp. TaxID=1411316 RepID=UPI002B6E80A0|nr:hypothetical protein [Pedobacter sp.]HMI01504.1 hypothetical protein [Pedobacter sp.]
MEQLKEQVERMLPLIESDKVSKSDIEQVISRVRDAIKQNPSGGKDLGQLIVRINGALKARVPDVDIKWVPAENGHLAIGHKPGGKMSFEGMKKAGTTVVLTLLHENEGARQIGSMLEKVDIGWVWFPFSASNPHSADDTAEVFALYEQLKRMLRAGNKIYVHCSAGIHRTGMITYGLLRYLGKESKEARQTLRELREVTADQVGDERLLWGNQFIINI